MKAFELHFNPRRGDERVFDSFVYEPANEEERQFGGLYMAGELNRALPQNKDFLENLSGVIKNNLYNKGDFSESLRGANDFLGKEAKSGNVNWLGNLNFAVISVRDSIINFTKVGNIKILLLREGEILDISQNLELQDTEPYPMKVFSNTASGKLSSEDKILILTKDVFSTISRNDALLNQLSRVTKEKELHHIFKLNRNIISEISGMCLFLLEGSTVSFGGMPSINFKFISFPQKIPKKIVLIVSLILIVVFSYFLFGDKSDKKQAETGQFQEALETANAKIMMAENFLIIKKEEKAQALFQEAWDILQPIDTKEADLLKESIKKYITISAQP